MSTARLLSIGLATLAVTVAPAAPENAPGLPAAEQILLPGLRGLIVVGDESLLADAPAVPADGLALRQTPSLAADHDFARLVATFLGQPVTFASLEQLQTAIRARLADRGKPYSLVYLPEQDISDGVVQLVVKESRLSGVRVEGNRWFSDRSYLSRLPLVEHGTIDQAELTTGLQRINHGGFRQATMRMGRGDAPATTEVVIVAQEQRPWRLNAGIHNAGTPTTGEERWTAGAEWGNAFGLGHRLGLNWSSDFKVEHTRSLSGNYTADLSNADLVTVFGAWSEVAADVPPPLQQAGTSWQVGLNYDRQLASVGSRFRHGWQAGLDFKSSDNNLDYILPPIVFPVSGNLTQIVQARLRYQGTLTDSWGYASAALQVVGAPGGLAGANHDDDFAGTRAGATADYVYATLDLHRGFTLRGVMTGWNWTLSGSLQLASGNLLGSEQFTAGGSALGRGYVEGAILGDNGVGFSQELAAPGFAVLSRLGVTDLRDQMRVYLFQDYARSWNVDELPGEHAYSLHSAGIGLRYQLGTHLSARLAQGWQLKDVHNLPLGNGRHFHFAVTMSY